MAKGIESGPSEAKNTTGHAPQLVSPNRQVANALPECFDGPSARTHEGHQDASATCLLCHGEGPCAKKSKRSSTTECPNTLGDHPAPIAAPPRSSLALPACPPPHPTCPCIGPMPLNPLPPPGNKQLRMQHRTLQHSMWRVGKEHLETTEIPGPCCLGLAHPAPLAQASSRCSTSSPAAQRSGLQEGLARLRACKEE